MLVPIRMHAPTARLPSCIGEAGTETLKMVIPTITLLKVINRQTLYLILPDRLQYKLFSTTDSGKLEHYQAPDPTRILEQTPPI